MKSMKLNDAFAHTSRASGCNLIRKYNPFNKNSKKRKEGSEILEVNNIETARAKLSSSLLDNEPSFRPRNTTEGVKVENEDKPSPYHGFIPKKFAPGIALKNQSLDQNLPLDNDEFRHVKPVLKVKYNKDSKIQDVAPKVRVLNEKNDIEGLALNLKFDVFKRAQTSFSPVDNRTIVKEAIHVFFFTFIIEVRNPAENI